MMPKRWLTAHVRYTVYYEDTDFSGYVYHANYLKYFERGREELIGPAFLQSLYQRGMHFVVVHAELSYRKPAAHGDCLEIMTRLPIISNPVWAVEHTAVKIPEDGGSPITLVTGTVKMAFIGSNGKLMSVPSAVLAHFDTLAASGRFTVTTPQAGL